VQTGFVAAALTLCIALCGCGGTATPRAGSGSGSIAAGQTCRDAFIRWAAANRAVAAPGGDYIQELGAAERAEVAAFDSCAFADLARLHDAVAIVPFVSADLSFRDFVEIECLDEGPPFTETLVCRELGINPEEPPALKADQAT
jgi:hypothetical protein